MLLSKACAEEPLAAIDNDRLAVDVGRRVGCEEESGVLDVLNAAESPDRDLSHQFVA